MKRLLLWLDAHRYGLVYAALATWFVACVLLLTPYVIISGIMTALCCLFLLLFLAARGAPEASIFKHRQIYGFTFSRWIRGHVFGVCCDSYLTPPESLTAERITCTKRMGHKSRHAGVDTAGYLVEAGQTVTWGIGDNLV